MAKETEAKRKSSNCCCNTYISIMISFKKIPSARSVTDSIKALALKVLFACRDEKMKSEIQPRDRAFNQFINSVCKQLVVNRIANTVRSKRESYPNNEWTL